VAVLEPSLVDLSLGPGERLGCLTVGSDEGIDMLLQLLDGGEGSAVQRLALEDGKPSLDLIEPRRPRRGEMEMHVGLPLEQRSFFLWVPWGSEMGCAATFLALFFFYQRHRISELVKTWEEPKPSNAKSI